MTASPAFDAMLAALRIHAGGDPQLLASRIAALDEDGQVKLLHLAARHRVTPLIAKPSMEIDEDFLPSSLRSAFREAASAQARTALLQLQTVSRLSDGFAAKGVDWILMKGLALSQRAYGDPLLKAGIDVDILVNEKDLPASFAVLRETGFSPIFPHSADDAALSQWHARAKESVWGGDKVQIDLHHRLADHDDVLSVPAGLPPTEDVALGNGVAVKALRLDWLLAHLAVHGASSNWFRWKWLTDVAALLYRLGPIGAQAVSGAGRLAPQREMTLMLTLAARWFERSDIDVPKGDVRTRIAERLCDLYLDGHLSGKEPTHVRMGTLPIHANQIILADAPLTQVAKIIKRARLNR